MRDSNICCHYNDSWILGSVSHGPVLEGTTFTQMLLYPASKIRRHLVPYFALSIGTNCSSSATEITEMSGSSLHSIEKLLGAIIYLLKNTYNYCDTVGTTP